MKKTFLVLGLVLMSSQAFATGGFSCSGESKKIKVSIDAVTTRSMNNALVSLKATVKYKQSEGFRDIEEVDFAKNDKKDDVVGYWNDDKNLNVALHFEDGTEDSFGQVDVVLTSVKSKDGESSLATAKITKSINGVSGPSTNSEHNVALKCSIEE